MSTVATASETSIREFLIQHDHSYRDLASEHHRYDQRLTEISSLSHPSEEEILEETVLKKKKLYLKDQMETIAARHRASQTSH